MTEEVGDMNEPKEVSVENPKMQFILAGFSEVLGFRIFAFEGIAADRTRTAFTVRTDLALSRRYGIRLQELPLLCRAVLERSSHDGETQSFTYTEEDMCVYAAREAAREEAAKQRKGPRRPRPDTIQTGPPEIAADAQVRIGSNLFDGTDASPSSVFRRPEDPVGPGSRLR